MTRPSPSLTLILGASAALVAEPACSRGLPAEECRAHVEDMRGWIETAQRMALSEVLAEDLLVADGEPPPRDGALVLLTPGFGRTRLLPTLGRPDDQRRAFLTDDFNYEWPTRVLHEKRPSVPTAYLAIPGEVEWTKVVSAVAQLVGQRYEEIGVVTVASGFPVPDDSPIAGELRELVATPWRGGSSKEWSEVTARFAALRAKALSECAGANERYSEVVQASERTADSWRPFLAAVEACGCGVDMKSFQQLFEVGFLRGQDKAIAVHWLRLAGTDDARLLEFPETARWSEVGPQVLALSAGPVRIARTGELPITGNPYELSTPPPPPPPPPDVVSGSDIVARVRSARRVVEVLDGFQEPAARLLAKHREDAAGPFAEVVVPAARRAELERGTEERGAVLYRNASCGAFAEARVWPIAEDPETGRVHEHVIPEQRMCAVGTGFCVAEASPRAHYRMRSKPGPEGEVLREVPFWGEAGERLWLCAGP